MSSDKSCPEKTIREIGEAAGLKGRRLELYDRYVSERFPGRHPSYIDEWAQTFVYGDEFAASDVVGQALLRRLGNYR